MWIDINTTLVTPDGIKLLFNKYNQFDFVITTAYNNQLKTSVMMAKPNSKLAYDTIIKTTEKLYAHYEIEKNTIEYVPYNYYKFIAPFIYFELLDFEYGKEVNYNELKKIHEYNCGLMNVAGILTFYGCNMSHHHGENFHKHWSIVQKTQKLFYI